MINKHIILFLLSVLIFTARSIQAQIYPDQFYPLNIDSLKFKIETSEGIKISDDGKLITLASNATDGYFILKEQTAQQPFNQGLPSYNGNASSENCAFKVQMRFPYAGSWSPWLTIGYWKNNLWTDYGITGYAGGQINVDWAILNSYVSRWQFKVIFTRKDLSVPSPSIHKLSLFVSDSRTTSNVNVSQIVSDNPQEIFIPTTHIFQYSIDPNYGGDMCSPTTVSMILKSYNIQVDPYKFAWATYDYYHKMFGIWPRVVQNASEYGLEGAVTRYRNWSETRSILEKGGRIAMSVGKPISNVGHLLMLAGFTNDGRAIVHDPGKSNGQSYLYDKTTITQAWFAKGGIAYTFFPAGNIVSIAGGFNNSLPNNFELFQNYPNPFNPETTIRFKVQAASKVSLKVFDVLGREVATLVDEFKQSGNYQVKFNVETRHGASLQSGIYFYRLQVYTPGRAGSFVQTKKMVLVK